MTDRNQNLFCRLTHNVVSLRAEPAGGSEQVSQGIVGDIAEIKDSAGDYTLLRTFDDYEGWALSSQCVEIDLSDKATQTSKTWYRILDPIATVLAEPEDSSRTITRAPYWSPFEVLGVEGEYLRIQTGAVSGYLKNISRFASTNSLPLPKSELSRIALKFVGTPYLWGGTTPYGFDCSGFVQRAYQSIGITLPRDAYQQAESPLGEKLSPSDRLQSGDLVFFLGARDPNQRGITHVGMMLDDRKLVHAYGKTGVTVAEIDDEEMKKSYQYRGGWRLPADRSVNR